MAEEVNINISITTNAAPVTSKITKELEGVRREAKAVKDDLNGITEPVKQGTKDFETLKNAVSPIKGLINDLTGGMSDAFFQAFASVKATTKGIKGLDLALKTAAFGIAILVIQSVIQLYDELVQSEEEEAEALKKATDARKEYVAELRSVADALDKEQKARSGGTNSIKREIAELEASGAASSKIYEKRKALLQQEKLDLIRRKEFLFDDAEAQQDIGQQILDKESELRALNLSNQKSNNEKRKANSAKAAQDRFDILNRENQRREEALKTHEDNVARIAKEAREKRIADTVSIAQFEQDEDMRAFNAELERLKKQKEAADARDKLRKEELDKEKAFRQQMQDLATDSALGVISSLKELNSIYDTENKAAAEKAFNRQKSLNIAETIVATYSAAQKAFNSQFVAGDPTALARAVLAASVATAGGLARVAAIKAQKFQWTDKEPSGSSISSAGGGSGGAGGGSVPQPQFNIVGQSGTNQLATSIGAQFDQPLRAYVVGGEVSTAQELERRRVRTATFG
jgi:hypothetical protein